MDYIACIVLILVERRTLDAGGGCFGWRHRMYLMVLRKMVV